MATNQHVFDSAALGEVYDASARRIYRYIYHRLGDAALAEDLTGEVFVRALDVIRSSASAPASLIAYLYRIAHNLIVDYWRRHPAPTRQALPLDESLLATDGDPVDAAETAMERAQLRAAVARLTETQQQVIVLKFVEGLTNAEVGRVLGKPEGAVKALQHRALVALREILGEAARV